MNDVYSGSVNFMSRKTCMVIVVAMIISIFSGAAGAQEKKPVKFLLPVSEGLGTEGFTKMMTKLAEAVGKATGIAVNYEQTIYKTGLHADDIVYERLKKGEVQMSYVTSEGYVENPKKWDDIFIPMFTLVFNNKVYNEYCLYAPKNSNIKTVEDAKGKVWGGIGTIYTRLILHDNGYDMPLSEFFSETKYVSDSPVTFLIEAQQKGEIEVFTAVRSHIMMGGGVPKSGSSENTISYKEVTCVEGNYGWIFGFNKSVDKDVIIGVTKSLMNAHKDKDFSEFKVLFMAIKGNFQKFKPEDLKRTKEIVKLTKDLGWKKEELEQIKKGK